MEFCVLGRIAVVVDGRELVLGSTHEAALLADLLVHAGQVVPASRLIDDLWRGRPPPGATATLQTYVKNLRRVLEPRRAQGAPSAVLASRRPGYLLNVEPDALDAWRCEGLVTGGRAALANGNAAAAAEQLRTALGLWRGPAYGELADESYVQSDAARWRSFAWSPSRTTSRRTWHCATTPICVVSSSCSWPSTLTGSGCGASGCWPSTELTARPMPCAAFQRIRRLLGDELGIEPGGALCNLERAILLHEPELDWSSTPSNGRPGRSMAADVLNPPAAVSPPARLTRAVEAPFVGRGQELAVMLEALAAADTERRRRVVLLCGEPGIGKTALAGTFARVAHEQGSSVSYGRCDEDLGLPYQPWATAVAHLMDHCPPGVLDEVVTTYGPDLGRLGPALSHLAPDSSPSGDPEIARHQLFSAVARVLEAAGRHARLVVVLDDLHWGDVPSLQLLRYLVGSELPVALVVVGTYRTSDVAPGGPFDDLLAWLHLETGVTRVELGGLDTTELSALLELSTGLSADRDTAALRDALERETDGNPFFVGELLRHLIETGVIACDAEGHWCVCGSMDEQGLPMNARTVIVHRVARLGDEAVRVLSLAAVMGLDFDLATLAAASGKSEDEVLDTLDAAIAAALVVNTAGDDFSFAHALVGHALSDALAPARRVRAHRRIATAIEGIRGPTPAARLPELAFHFAEACGSSSGDKDLQRAISYAHAAGDAALQRPCSRPGVALVPTSAGPSRARAGRRAIVAMHVDGGRRRRPTPGR